MTALVVRVGMIAVTTDCDQPLLVPEARRLAAVPDGPKPLGTSGGGRPSRSKPVGLPLS